MQQYGFELDIGRVGATFSVYRLDKAGSIEYSWSSTFNSRGMKVIRTCESPGSSGEVVVLCEEDTFLYPDRVEDDELKLVDLLAGFPVREDHWVISLVSLLVAKWAAGHSEESFYDTIRETISKWSKLSE